jgi:hypothetical protein
MTARNSFAKLLAMVWLDFADWFYGRAAEHFDRVYQLQTEHRVEVPK